MSRFVTEDEDVTFARVLGGPGSGNFGHAGRPGSVGGSSRSDSMTREGAESLLNSSADLLVSTEDEPATEEAMASHELYYERLEELAHEGGDFRQEAIDDYTGEGYVTINRVLHQTPKALDREVRRGKNDEYNTFTATRKAHELQEAIQRAPALKEPVIVYRGYRGDFQLPITGDILTMRGFQSASFDPKVAAEFTDRKGGLLKITAKKGLALGQNSRGGEAEFIMDHQSRYRIDRVHDIEVDDPGYETEKIHVIEVTQL